MLVYQRVLVLILPHTYPDQWHLGVSAVASSPTNALPQTTGDYAGRRSSWNLKIVQLWLVYYI
jgi:hypothetical protein